MSYGLVLGGIALLSLSVGGSFGRLPTAHLQHRTVQGECGRLHLWHLPEGLIIESTATDRRTIDVLRTQARINLIVLAAESYCAERGAYPTSYQSMLRFGQVAPAEHRECALRVEALKDAWGRPIFYGMSRGTPLVVSSGIDGRFTTADDIVVPDSSADLAKPLDLAQECTSARR